MKAYFIVVKYESGEKEVCYLNKTFDHYVPQITFSHREAENIIARLMDNYGPQGIEYILHEVEV